MSAMFANAGSAESKRRAERLAAQLAGIVGSVQVEARDGLAVLRVPAAEAARLGEPVLRREVLAMAKAEGFSHVAVELG